MHTTKRCNLVTFVCSMTVAFLMLSALYFPSFPRYARADSNIACGTIITGDTTLSQDIGPCSDNGIQIGADGITLDCAGHTISGNTSAGSFGIYGIYVLGKKNVTVTNCISENFTQNGFRLENTAQSTLSNNTAISNGFGFGLFNSSENVLTTNKGIRDVNFGYYLDLGSSYNRLQNNISTNDSCSCTGTSGFAVLNGQHNSLLSNNVTGSYNGFTILADNNTLQDNYASHNFNSGYFFLAGRGNVLTDNVADENVADGFQQEFAGFSTMTGNVAEHNGGEGFNLSVNNSTLQQNIAIQNHGNGINIIGSGNIVTDNRSTGNIAGGYLVQFDVQGDVLRNFAGNNSGSGFEFQGSLGDKISANNADGNGGNGFHLDSVSNNTIANNTSTNNNFDGFLVLSQSSGNLVDGNFADTNARYGIEDNSTGIATNGTANTYQQNECTGNVIGQSNPVGLCITPVDTTITSATYDHGKILTDGSHVHSPFATFNFTGTSGNGISGFECSLDGSAFASCTAPVTYKVTIGQHTFEVRAINSGGLPDTTPASFTWTRGK